MLEKLFHLKQKNTSVKRELLAGFTTYLTMSYILIVNPSILSQTGMDKGALFVATCVASIIGCIIMALVANWPIALAPGMGLNAFFAYSVVLGMGYSWQKALGAVFISGIIFIILSATGIRKYLTRGVPASIRSGIAAGIGMFLAIVALHSAGIIVKNDATLVGLGDMTKPASILTMLGFILIVTFYHYRFRAAILFGIIFVTLVSFFIDPAQLQTLSHNGIVSAPPSIMPTFLKLDIPGVLNRGIFHILLAFVLVEVFDATGTLVGIGTRAGLIKEDRKDNLSKALFADSCAILIGSLLGTSSTTAYVESASGVEAGGRTGLTALTVAVLFAISLFFSPLLLLVPSYATAPALLFVACLMIREFANISWEHFEDAGPAALTALMMPLTYSIADGIAFGFISYTLIKTLTGKIRQAHPATCVITLLFVLRFIIH